ncbi:MAG: PKD domain-containing protein, partial [Ilumatobacter sp.]|nr:PKD domain-containing protein [Ilumatobacter sp.]
GSVSKNLLTIDPQVCDLCIPDIFFDDPARTGEEFGLGAEASIDSSLTWTAAVSNELTFNDTLLKQGQTLDAEDTLTTGAGTVEVRFGVDAAFGIYERHGDFDGQWVQTTATVHESAEILAVSIPCSMPLPGESPRDCTSPPTNVTVFSVPVAPGVEVTFGLQFSLTVTVDGSGIVTLRKAEIVGGSSVAEGNLTFAPTSPAVVADPLTLTCAQPAGNDLTYAMTDNSYTADTSLDINISPTLGISLDLFPDPDPWVLTTFSVDLFEYPTLTMTAPDVSKNLGPLAADNVPPVANPGGGVFHQYSGLEGTAVQFDGTGSSDNCGFPTLRWDFSDGGVAYGPNPSHVFADNGTYTGLLTATDVVGNTSTATFTVVVGNVAPVAEAGPDGSGAWGRPIQFNGAGTDPGSADQNTLTYRWDFGDGSPSATGGPSVAHAYSVPGTYTATLTVRDKDGASHTDTRQVLVRRRTTALGMLGATSGTYATPTSLSASLVDEFGQAVNGRIVVLGVAGDVPVSSSTNSSGIATAAYTPALNAGPYTTSAAFAGDSLYEAANGGGNFAVAAKATSMTYTGAVTGGPNKTVLLSATLVDATGTPLAGRTVVFKLGTQTVSATTNATGDASTNLKLAQKNGTYQLSATWTPAGADVGHFTGSSATKTFKLQAK